VYEARVEQAQTAMTEHEAEYQTRLTELERIAQEREAEYKTRLNEGDVQIASYQAQIEEITQAMAAHQDQVAPFRDAPPGV
jgi:flagellar biosynthesis chaperone FliJ